MTVAVVAAAVVAVVAVSAVEAEAGCVIDFAGGEREARFVRAASASVGCVSESPGNGCANKTPGNLLMRS